MEPTGVDFIVFGLAAFIGMAIQVFPILLPIFIVLYLLRRKSLQRFEAQFRAMSPAQQMTLLSTLAAQHRWGRIDRVMSHTPGPMTESIMHYGAANGIDTSFLNKYV
jgi:hypothetical protein